MRIRFRRGERPQLTSPAARGDDGGFARVGQRVGLREVAEAAGVALSSASRALSGHPDVSDQTRERVHAAARDLGYEPNLVWESLRRGSTRSVGFIVRDISSPLFAEIAREAELSFRERGYSLLVANSMGAPELDVGQIRLLNQRRVDGLMLSPSDVTDPGTLATLERLPIPHVAIDRDLPASLGGSAVLIDQYSGMCTAVQHLLELGHRSIGYVSPLATSRPAQEAARALADVCGEAGAEFVIDAGPFSEEHGAAGARRLLEREDRPTALISGSNQIFPGVLGTLRERGLQVPGDVSLITFDDLPLLEYLDPPVAVVSRKPSVVGQTAAKLMLELLEGGPARIVVTPTEFTARSSCAPPAKTPAGARSRRR